MTPTACLAATTRGKLTRSASERGAGLLLLQRRTCPIARSRRANAARSRSTRWRTAAAAVITQNAGLARCRFSTYRPPRSLHPAPLLTGLAAMDQSGRTAARREQRRPLLLDLLRSCCCRRTWLLSHATCLVRRGAGGWRWNTGRHGPASRVAVVCVWSSHGSSVIQYCPRDS